MICATLMIGVIIPPVAVCVFDVRNITGISTLDQPVVCLRGKLLRDVKEVSAVSLGFPASD